MHWIKMIVVIQLIISLQIENSLTYRIMPRKIRIFYKIALFHFRKHWNNQYSVCKYYIYKIMLLGGKPPFDYRETLHAVLPMLCLTMSLTRIWNVCVCLDNVFVLSCLETDLLQPSSRLLVYNVMRKESRKRKKLSQFAHKQTSFFNANGLVRFCLVLKIFSFLNYLRMQDFHP